MPAGHRPPPPPGTARVALSGTSQGHRWTCVFWLDLDGTGIIQNDLKTVTDAIALAFNNRLLAPVSNTVSLQTVTCVFIPSAGNELVYEGTYTYTGANANNPVDDVSCCYVVQWKIAAYYRGGHPRTYLTGPTVNNVNNGSDVSGAEQSALATAAQGFRNDVNALTSTNITSVKLGTVSFQTGNAWRTTPLFRPYTGAAINPKIGSQRRRIHA